MIGKLRHRITLQKSVVVKDDIGQEIEQWQDIGAVWASIEPLNGKEYFVAKQINSKVSTKIIMRYQKNILPTMRVKFNDQIYEIAFVINPEEKCVFLELLCQSTVKEGESDD